MFFCLQTFSASSYNIGNARKNIAKPRAQRLSSYDFLKLCHRKHMWERVTVTSHAKHSKGSFAYKSLSRYVQISIDVLFHVSIVPEFLADLYIAHTTLFFNPTYLPTRRDGPLDKMHTPSSMAALAVTASCASPLNRLEVRCSPGLR